jgi:hypothetical protein
MPGPGSKGCARLFPPYTIKMASAQNRYLTFRTPKMLKPL